ncbi:hypothetical protein [Anthocerotibacter panamensis]|uniref:hypothetical protein n=1 Tax=Anthocerotibacter panamensis TaxID=2857077 RepID=UPI001C4062D9|nr:hypothetical protein [Anthocerotibacter panamensis]
MPVQVYQAPTGGGKTTLLRQRWLAYPDPEAVLVWVENAAQVQSWLQWHEQTCPGRVLQLGTFRAWPRRWLERYWPRLAPLRCPERPRLPSVLGAQWLMRQVVREHPAWTQTFWEQGWSEERLVAHLVRWEVARQERVERTLLPVEGEHLLHAYAERAWRDGILDYGQQLRVLETYFLKDEAWLQTIAQAAPYWLWDDFQEWPPFFHTLLAKFQAHITLELGYNPEQVHHQPVQEQTRALLAPHPIYLLPQAIVHPLAIWLTAMLTATPVHPPGGLSVHWVEAHSRLWSQVAQVVQALFQSGATAIVLLVPRADALLESRLRHALQLPLHWLFPEQDLLTRLPAQLVWTALRWVDPLTWGTATPYDTAQLLELGLGLAPGQSLHHARLMHRPLWEPVAETPTPCLHLYTWRESIRKQPTAEQWTSIFTQLLTHPALSSADQLRLEHLWTLGVQLLEVGGPPALHLLQEGCILPRWELPVDPQAVVVTSPRGFVESGRTSRHQIWLDVTAAAWQTPPTEGTLLAHLQTCLMRNQETLTLLASSVDGGGERQQGPLSPLVAQITNP